MIKRTTTALLFASAAVAALAVAPAKAGDFEGGYLGAQLGYTYGEFSINVSDFDSDSVIGGISAGYLWSLGNGWYVGPEFQYDWADIKITDSSNNQTATFDRIGRLNLVAGYELGNGLLYGSVGYAYTDLQGVGSFFDGSSDGYAVGVGYDWFVDDNWTVGAQYLFQSFNGVGSGGGDVDVNAIYLKTSYRF